MTKLGILLADDHETVREGLKVVINAQSDMHVIAEVPDGHAAVAKTAALTPDIVIMDVSMPGLNGLKASEEIQRRCPTVRIVALTRHADEGYLKQLLRAGVSGYVLKQSRTAELLYGIRAVAGGGQYIDPAVAVRVADHGRRGPHPTAGSAEPRLSPREDETLRLVAWGYSNKEIATRLELSVKTVEAHKTNASHKLGLHNRIDVVRYALLQGWLQDT